MSLLKKSIQRTLKGTLIAAAACAAMVTASASAADKVYRLKLAETWGPNFPIFGDTTKNMANKRNGIGLNIFSLINCNCLLLVAI